MEKIRGSQQLKMQHSDRNSMATSKIKHKLKKSAIQIKHDDSVLPSIVKNKKPRNNNNSCLSSNYNFGNNERLYEQPMNLIL